MSVGCCQLRCCCCCQWWFNPMRRRSLKPPCFILNANESCCSSSSHWGKISHLCLILSPWLCNSKANISPGGVGDPHTSPSYVNADSGGPIRRKRLLESSSSSVPSICSLLFITRLICRHQTANHFAVSLCKAKKKNQGGGN